jgi:hypothetical protein
MRTYEIWSPSAAERYFNNSIVGHISMLLAEAWGSVHRRRPVRGAAQRHVRGSAPPSLRSRRQGWLDRLDAWFWRQEQKDRDAYLAGSHDVFELERRIEALERGMITRYY